MLTSVASSMVKTKPGKKGAVGTGVQLGVNALLAKTVLKRLPFPFNLFLPHMVQNLAFNYVDKYGREYLIKGLEWVRDITEEDEEDVEVSPATTDLVVAEPVLPPVIVEEEVSLPPAVVVEEPIVPNPIDPPSPYERNQ